eukprot:5120108-Lingulodinium_polyedra.AAC.1
MPASTRASHIRYATIASTARARRRNRLDYEALHCHAAVRATKRPHLSGGDRPYPANNYTHRNQSGAARMP